MIAIPQGVVAEMVAHARAEAPVEACGLLVGSGTRVTRSCRMTNVDGSAEHFCLDPREQLAVITDARAEGLQVLGVYHSHPATPARMSDEDLRLAFTPEFHYVVVSLADPRRPEVRSFVVDEGRPYEEQVVVEESEP